MSRNDRRWQNDSMSMDDYSDIAIIDQSPKFQKSHNGLDKQSYLRTSPATRSSTQQNTLRRPRQNHHQNHHQQHQHQHQQHQQHRPHHLPQKHSSTLESLVQKPKSFHSTTSTEKIKRPESHATKHSSKTTKTTPQTKKSKMNKLKMLNCFAGSSNKHRHDDPEALRQQALIARAHYGRTVPNIPTKDVRSFNQPDMGNSPTSTTTMRTEDCFFDAGRSIASTRRRTRQRKTYHHDTQHILEDLHEEEQSPSNSSGEDRGGSFINLSISDIEDRLGQREAVPFSTVEEKRAKGNQQQVAMQEHQQAQKAYGSTTIYQTMPIPSPPKQPAKRIPGRNAMPQNRPNQSTPPTQPTLLQQYHEQQQQEQHQFTQQHHIPGQNAFEPKIPVQTPPNMEQHRPEQRPTLTKEQQHYQQLQKQKYYKQRISQAGGVKTPRKGAGPAPWIKPISSVPVADDQSKTLKNLATDRQGPRCHFCGGSHWIYNCPHMDESSAASRRRRHQYYEYDDEDSDYSSSRDSSTVYSRQSDPLQCQPCLKHVTKVLKERLQSSP